MDYEIGDIVKAADGCPEMIIRFYQVVGTTKTTVRLRQIYCKEVSKPQRGRGIIIRGTVKPIKDMFYGDRVITGYKSEWGHIRIKSTTDIYAYKWDGNNAPYDICHSIRRD